MRQSGCFPTYNVPAAGITVPIIPGLKPLTTKKQVDVLPETISIDIPRELTQVPAIHFYTMGKSQNITDVLRAAF